MATGVGTSKTILTLSPSEVSTISPLFQAAKEGNLNAVITLLANTDPNAINERGRTALHEAAYRGHTEIVEALLADNRTKPNITDAVGVSPLVIAIRMGHLEIFNALLADKRINLKTTGKLAGSPLYEVISKLQVSHTALYNGLVECKSDADYQNFINEMEEAIKNPTFERPHIDMIETLLARDDIDPDIGSASGVTPLNLAAREGFATIVKALLARANPNIVSIEIKPPLHSSYIRVVKALLKHPDTDLNIRDGLSRDTPLINAARKERIDIFSGLLADSRTDPTLTNNRGENSLYYVVLNAFTTSNRDLWLKEVSQLTESTKAISNPFATALEAAKNNPDFPQEGLAFLIAHLN